MKHGPSTKHAVGDSLADKPFHGCVAVIMANARICGFDPVCGSFEQLKVDIVSANKRACNAISFVASSRINQNATKHRAIVSKGLRGVDKLDEVHGIRLSVWERQFDSISPASWANMSFIAVINGNTTKQPRAETAIRCV